MLKYNESRCKGFTIFDWAKGVDTRRYAFDYCFFIGFANI